MQITPGGRIFRLLLSSPIIRLFSDQEWALIHGYECNGRHCERRHVAARRVDVVRKVNINTGHEVICWNRPRTPQWTGRGTSCIGFPIAKTNRKHYYKEEVRGFCG